MTRYDVAIVGGGLAGLTLSIQIAKAGYQVILFEKETYPFHRVCGEYISLESWDHLLQLGMKLEDFGISFIKRLQVSDVAGNSVELTLPLGGFGVSRYKLDFELAQLARSAGVRLCEGTRVNDIQFSGEGFEVNSSIGNFEARMTAGAFGKRSNIDVKWKRPFAAPKTNKLNNWIGVKYHVLHDAPCDLVAIHNFPDGYCGMSRVEGDLYCLCYLTTADNLRKSNNDVGVLEGTILSVNPHLKQIFSQITKVNGPLTISQVNFDNKNSIENHVIMIGDAAGMITPLCGNGMSMAMHGSKIAAIEIDKFLRGTIDRKQMERNYTARWQKLFSLRLKAGRLIHRLLSYPVMTSVIIRLGKICPSMMRALIRKTHGLTF